MGGVMDRSAILAAARQAIVVDRAATHGAAEASFAAIAGGWNWWLGLGAGPAGINRHGGAVEGGQGPAGLGAGPAGINRSGGAIEGGQGPAGLRRGALTPVDVGAMMILLKLARAAANPGHADNWVDVAGWGALAGELALAAGHPDPVQAGYDDLADRRMDQPTMDADVAQVTGLEAAVPDLVPATLPPWVAMVAQAVSRSPAVVGSPAKPKPSPRRVVRLTRQTRWNPERCARLAQMVQHGASNAEVAAEFGATVKAVANRIYRLRQSGALPLLAVLPQDAVPGPEPAVMPERAAAPAGAGEPGPEGAAMVWNAPTTAALLEMLAAGRSHAAIASALGVSTKTVSNKIYKMRAAAQAQQAGAAAPAATPAPEVAPPLPPATLPRELRLVWGRIEALPPAPDWPPARDLDLAERLMRGQKLALIAAEYGLDKSACKARFADLSRGVRDPDGDLAIEAGPKLLAVLRTRLAPAQPEVVLRTQVEVAHG